MIRRGTMISMPETCICGKPAKMAVRVTPYVRKSHTSRVPISPISEAARRAHGNPYLEGACSQACLRQIGDSGRILAVQAISDETVERQVKDDG